jgi:ribosome-associated heat shock protein Hsp15
MSGNTEDSDWQRLDKWLWCARFMKQRSDCARLIAEGFLRINRQPTEKAHARLRVGDIVTLPLRGDVHVIEVLSLATRRGPASEAQSLYRKIIAPQQPCADSDMTAYREA